MSSSRFLPDSTLTPFRNLLRHLRRSSPLKTKSQHAPLKVHNDRAILSGWTFLYHYPSTLPDASNVVVGIVSKLHHFKARQAIRSTWASESHHQVSFIVAGPGRTLNKSFRTTATCNGSTWKKTPPSQNKQGAVGLLLHAVRRSMLMWIPMNTSSKPMMTRTFYSMSWSTIFSKQSKSDNWGNCLDSHHAHRMGYALSRDFVECATTFIESTSLFSSKEDVATGELAKLCGVTCQQEG